MDAIEWDRRYRERAAMWGDEPAASLVEALLPHRGSGAPSAVELAAGDGRHSAWLAENGYHVTAVEFAASAVEAGRRRTAELPVHWVQADARDWLPEQPLDLVLVPFLQLPVAQMAGLLRRAAGWLSRHGQLLYLGHARSNLEHGSGGPQDPAVLTEPADLAAAAPGLRILRCEHVVHAPQPGHGAGNEPGAGGPTVDVLLHACRWQEGSGHTG